EISGEWLAEAQLLASDTDEEREACRPRAATSPPEHHQHFYVDRKLDVANLRVSTLYYPGRPQYVLESFSLEMWTVCGESDLIPSAYLRAAGHWERLVLLLELVASMNFPPAAFPPPPDPDRELEQERRLTELEDKVAQDTAYWDVKERLQQLQGAHERLQQNMVDVQMQHEAASAQYARELRLRPDTLN
ncbi:hypothetical protein B5X24_HaOG216305, partial [Helicoverpa armigera]